MCATSATTSSACTAASGDGGSCPALPVGATCSGLAGKTPPHSETGIYTHLHIKLANCVPFCWESLLQQPYIVSWTCGVNAAASLTGIRSPRYAEARLINAVEGFRQKCVKISFALPARWCAVNTPPNRTGLLQGFAPRAKPAMPW